MSADQKLPKGGLLLRPWRYLGRMNGGTDILELLSSCRAGEQHGFNVVCNLPD